MAEKRWSRRVAGLAALGLAAGGLALAGPGPAAAAPAPDPACPWADTRRSPDQRARLLLAASSFEQKLRWLDEQSANNPAQTVFSIGGGQTVTMPPQVPCTPVIQYTDGPQAVSGAGTGVTAFPAQIALSATWDTRLARAKGRAYAAEAFGKHRNVALAPGLASGRDPRSGRTSEYLGEDPLLAGTLAAANVRGLGDDEDRPVEAVLKHYVANEQEIDRQLSSSNVDARTLRQIYTLPFGIAVEQSDPGGVMCAYNQVNGTYACENALLLDRILRDELGFDGFVMTDFGARHSLASDPPSLAAGLDQELNRWRFWTPALIQEALAAGRITAAQVDRAAFRVVRAHIAAGLFDVPLPDAPADVVTTPAHVAVAREVAEKGAVLLKNDALLKNERLLPLGGRDRTVAVIGATASAEPTDGISAASVCGPTAPSVPCTPVAPLDAIRDRAAATGGTVTFDAGTDPAAAARTAAAADVAVVFGHYRAGEFADRPNLSLDGNGDALVAAVAAANPRTVVVLQTGGPVLMPWLADVPAVLETWYAGEQMGPAVAALLWGDVSPSGRLTHTFPRSEADLPTAGSPRQYPGTFADGGTTRPPGSTEIRQVDYAEGLQVGYRWYDARGIEPLFPFGHGLTYTRFAYSNLQVTPVTDGRATVRVRFTVRNTGRRAGTEVPQVYLTLPGAAGEPFKRLAGFDRVELRPGQARTVEVTIDPGSAAHPLSFWDTRAGRWRTAPGAYGVHAGPSVGDLPLRGAFRVR